MTPDTSASFGGFLQGMQANLISLVGAIAFFLVIWMFARIMIAKFYKEGSDTVSAYRFINWTAGVLILLTLAGFVASAATFATNQIQHSDLDKSPVHDEINSNIKKH